MPDQGAGMTREQRYAYDQWLRKAEKAAQTAVDDQTSLSTATQEQEAATIRLHSAQEAYKAALAAVTDGLKDQAAKDTAIRAALGDTSSPLAKAQRELTDATSHETQTSSNLGKANQRLSDANRDAAIEAESKPPWEGKAAEAAVSPDANAAAMGAGLIKGMAQELGFGDVFGKPPWEWGIWKLFAGGASYGLGLLNAMGEAGAAPGSMPAAFPVPGGPAPGGEGAPPLMPEAGQHLPGQAGANIPDAQGAYTLPSGEKDIPDAQGGYATSHGADWTYSADTKRYYPPGKGPTTQAPAAGTGTEPHKPDESAWLGNTLGEGESWHIGGDGSRTKWKGGKPIPGENYGPDGKKRGAAPAGPQPQVGQAPGPQLLPPALQQLPPDTPPPPELAPSGGESAPFRSNVQIAPSSFEGGGLTSLISGMDWLMHPAGNAVREAYRRGDIQGPPWASSVTPQMAASQAPVNVPVAVGPQTANVVSINTTNHGTLKGEDEAAKLVTSAQIKRSGWHPSMQAI
jgi:hypothetical protein